MKFLISYFYKIRFFKPNMIPISTALWDPKWYHEFKDQSHYFTNKDNVVYGLRYPPLNPSPDCECTKGDCKHDAKCSFIENYYKKISQIDFDKMIYKFTWVANWIQEYLDDKTQEMVIVLIVHEAPNNPCSERSSLVRLFKEHGIELNEF